MNRSNPRGDHTANASPREQAAGAASAKPGGTGSSLLFLLALPVLGAVFGSSSLQLGGWFVCPPWIADRQSCSPLAMAEAGMLTLAVGFLVIIALGAYLAHRRGNGADAVLVGAAVTVIGGVYSAFRATEKLPDGALEAAIQFLFFVLVAGVLFVLPTFIRPYAEARWSELARFYGGLALAALIGGALTTIVQLVPLWLPTELFPPVVTSAYRWDHPSFYFSRPVGTGVLMSAWILLTFDPWFHPQSWKNPDGPLRRFWPWGFAVLAVGLIASYALLLFGQRHSVWLDKTDISPLLITTIFLCLLMPPVPAAAVLLDARKRGRWELRLAATLIAVSGGVLVALILIAKASMPEADAILFAVSHSLSALIAVVAAFAAVSLTRSYAMQAPAS